MHIKGEVSPFMTKLVKIFYVVYFDFYEGFLVLTKVV